MAKKAKPKNEWAPKPMSERELLREIMKAFEHDAIITLHRRNVGGMQNNKGQFVRFGEPGQSDLFGTIKAYRCHVCGMLCEGITLEIEVKSAKGKLTAKQVAWQEKVRQNNGVAITVRPTENDPVGLWQRVTRLVEREIHPKCYEQSKKK